MFSLMSSGVCRLSWETLRDPELLFPQPHSVESLSRNPSPPRGVIFCSSFPISEFEPIPYRDHLCLYLCPLNSSATSALLAALFQDEPRRAWYREMRSILSNMGPRGLLYLSADGEHAAFDDHRIAAGTWIARATIRTFAGIRHFRGSRRLSARPPKAAERLKDIPGKSELVKK